MSKKLNKKKAVILLLAAVIVLGGGIGGYLYYDAARYFRTENASIKADTIIITPLITGKVLSWNVKEGDTVKKDQALGQQDTSGMISSSTINMADLGNSAGNIVEKSMIKSPIDGQVIKSYVVEGETVSPGMELAVVADMGAVYVLANVEETDIFKVKAGQKVDLSIDAYPRKKFAGYVSSVGFAAQSAFSNMPSLNTSGTYSKTTQLIPVKISMINDENLPMLLGMNATVKIHLMSNSGN